MSTLSIVLVMWLGISAALTLAWMILITIRNNYGTFGNFLELQIRKYFKP